ncbi:MAG: sensor histidine kinase [Sulfurimonadaceae bacterium]
MRALFQNLPLRLLSGLFLFLSIVFSLFYLLIISILNTHYNKELEMLLQTTLKDISYEYAHMPKKNYDFNHIKEEFDIPTLYIQIFTLDAGKPRFLFRSNDLGTHNLSFVPKKLPHLTKESIFFEKQEYKELSNNPIEVGYTLLDEGVYLMCAIPYERKNPQIEYAKETLFAGLSVLLLTLLLLFYAIIKHSLAQTKKVLEEVRTIHIDSHMPKIRKTHIASEIDELIETFNTLLAQLQNSYIKIKEFGQNASHELKTPLTILRGEIEVGLRKERSTQEYQTILKSSLAEIERLQDIIEKILFLSTNAQSDIKSRFEPCYVEEILEEVIEQKKALALPKAITLRLLQNTPLTVEGNPLLLNLALSNLLENAIKYSSEGTTIEISLSESELRIQDHGIGIKEEHLGKIFDRFYRIEKNQKGSGLGLSIVKNILELHAIDISIESHLGEGTLIVLSFLADKKI